MNITDEMVQAAVEKAIELNMLPKYLKDFKDDKRRANIRKILEAGLSAATIGQHSPS